MLRPLVAAYQSRRRQKLTEAAAQRLARRPVRAAVDDGAFAKTAR
jgi:hypothetical protein